MVIKPLPPTSFYRSVKPGSRGDLAKVSRGNWTESYWSHSLDFVQGSQGDKITMWKNFPPFLPTPFLFFLKGVFWGSESESGREGICFAHSWPTLVLAAPTGPGATGVNSEHTARVGPKHLQVRPQIQNNNQIKQNKSPSTPWEVSNTH